jgi:hypothetical protein
MKKTITGSVFMLSGVILFIGIIITGAINFPSVTQWEGNLSARLWVSITNLSLRIPFILGVIFVIIGLVMLIVEYFNRNE